jgi:L-threonylcarbamoyladenylate synthase
VREIKHRWDDKAFILLCSGEAMLRRYVHVPVEATDLLNLSLDVPVTIVYDRVHGAVPVASDGSVAIRVPASPGLRAFVDRVGVPLLSTSANVSGAPAPRTMKEVDPSVQQAVDMIWDDEVDSNHTGLASTLVRFDGGHWNVLRRGSGAERVERVATGWRG